MSRLQDALRDPFQLTPNRAPRFYRGGRLLDEFRAEPGPRDTDRPEDWVGSATATWTPPGASPRREGISTVELPDGPLALDRVLDEAPEALTGDASAQTLGVLVKLLDAGQRLPVHCHPTRAMAQSVLGSAHGKTEAWLILGTRGDADARVWAGFREPIARDVLRRWIEEQATDQLLEALVPYRVAPGDALLVPGGVPHAIGAGVFLLELQEPTDFSVVAETRGFPIDSDAATLGLGWDRAIRFFHTDAGGDLRQEPRPLAAGALSVFGPDADPYFRAVRSRLDGMGEDVLPFEPSWAVGVVLRGRGILRGHGRSLVLSRGVTVGVPAAAVAFAHIEEADDLEVVWCLPPRAG